MQNKPIKKTALLAALMVELTSVQAADIDVNNSTCTLSDAITAANTDFATGGCTAGSGDDVINLPTESNISLTEALPAIINNVTINANDSTINRNVNAQNQFSLIQLGSLAYIDNLPTLTLNDVILGGGVREDNLGGGISTINSSLILNNSTVSGNVGGAITLSSNNNSEINNSVISGNLSSSTGSYYGGAISVNSGTLIISNTTIADNASSSGFGGGGIYATNFGGTLDLEINNSTISNNSTVFDGGGVFQYTFYQYTTNVNININSSTIVNNQSGDNGGGIHAEGNIFTVSQSIVSGNTTNNNGAEINVASGTATLEGFNIIGLNGNSGLAGVTTGVTDIVPTETNLSDIIDIALADNGGNTLSHNLVVGSPAIDAINAPCDQATDQVGNNRPIDGNGNMIAACDIGSVEYQPVDDSIFNNGFEPPNN